MKKTVTRKERLCTISSILTQNPSEIYPLSYFADMFGAAKSTMSEDVAIIREAFERQGMGTVAVVMGANGGVKYRPKLSDEVKKSFAQELCEKLSSGSRILPGGFIYTDDIFLDPKYVDKMARIIYGYYQKSSPDFIITIETKGIPLAMEVARLFGKNLVVARKESKLTEGSVITLNYLSGSSKRMQTMSLSKRAVKEGQRALIVDDFIAGGGTVSAVAEMMKEFSITVVGCGIAIATKEPERKRVEGYKSIVTLNKVDEENGLIDVSASEF